MRFPDEVRARHDLTKGFEHADHATNLARRGDLTSRERRYLKAIRDLEMSASDFHQQSSSLKKKHSELTKKLAESKESLSRQQASQAKTNAQIESLKGKIEALQVTEVNLRADLQRVRSSRTFRAGKIVAIPVRVFRKLKAHLLKDKSDRQEATEQNENPSIGSKQVAELSARPNIDKKPTEDAKKQAVATTPKSNTSLDDLREAFSRAPSPETFLRLVYRLWFTHGALAEAVGLIEKHPDFLAKQQQQVRNVLHGILGEARVPEVLDHIPPVASAPAYNPEAGRILYCVHSAPTFNSNGYSTRTKGVAEGLRAAGADVVVVTRVGYPWDTKTDVVKPAQERTAKELDGIEYVHLHGSGLGRVPVDRYILECADAFVREALLQRPEIIQAASNHRTGLSALIAARRLGIPFVYEIRGMWEMSEATRKPLWEGSEHYELLGRMEIELAKRADRVLAITPQIKEYLATRGVSPDLIDVAPNAVNTNEFLPLPRDAEYATDLRIKTDVPVIGFAGSMESYEGLDLLIRASAKLHKDGVRHQLVFAGSGSEEAKLKELAKLLRLNHVIFVGRLPISQVPRLLSTFDIMPLPRLRTPVTDKVSPLKPLEAFGAMKAVLMSDLPPHRDLTHEGQSPNALLFSAGDVDDLADKLKLLIESSDLRMNLGRSARLWTVRTRTWDHVGSAMRASHGTAKLAHSTKAKNSVNVEKSRLKVGIIADEFTTQGLEASFDLVVIDRSNWREQLENGGLDFVFIESAWNGNDGSWHRAVGDYGPEEHSDIEQLLDFCRSHGIPSVFWNKEDPVHFARFKSTAVLCDHVFTTDAKLIQKYFGTKGSKVLTVSSLPFFAQPRIHNPLDIDYAYEHTLAYAGTFYGERYAERSKALEELLDLGEPYGLTIYDRQADKPNSPYKFPQKFEKHSRGAIPYGEVIHTYKKHLAHLNVNSVTDSPTMFSRRVVEIAASGGIVISGAGRGIAETFNGNIPVYGAENNRSTTKKLLDSISQDARSRCIEAWRQHRAVYRTHTVNTALPVLTSTIGVPLARRAQPKYVVWAPDLSRAQAEAVLRQSLRPIAVVTQSEGDDVDILRAAGVPIVAPDAAKFENVWLTSIDGDEPRTWFEDLLTSTFYGDWDVIASRHPDATERGLTLASAGMTADAKPVLVNSRLTQEAGFENAMVATIAASEESNVVTLTTPPYKALSDRRTPSLVETFQVHRPEVILLAGHDLKFAGELKRKLLEHNHKVLVDKWEGHTGHDEGKSRELLEQADIVWCEWGLGNVRWYSKEVRPYQRLVTRIHLQEISTRYLKQTNHRAVDAFVFIGELIKEAAIASHGIPREKAYVIPNTVDVTSFGLPKKENAHFNLGFVGMVPERKRVDLALDLVEKLRASDSRYRLFIKGKTPHDYPWMANRPEEMKYFDRVFERIDELNYRYPGIVTLDPHGNDMPEWYQKIGVTLSVSDFESFHYSIADGAASGAFPASLAWAGSDLLYPTKWLSGTIDEMVDAILTRDIQPVEAMEYIRSRYAADTVAEVFANLLVNDIAPE